MRQHDESKLSELIDELIQDAEKLKKFDLERFFDIKERTKHLIALFFRNPDYLINTLNAVNYDVYLTPRDRQKLLGFFRILKDRMQFPSYLKVNDEFPSSDVPLTDPVIFIGHGRSKLWARLKVFVEDKSDLNLRTVHFESQSRIGESIVTILEEMLEKARFAVIILTAEDKTSSGSVRARQNVIHEIGLFQGRLGFERVVLLMQDGVERFSNIAGLQYIPFSDDKIEKSFYELRAVLKRERMIK